MKEKLEKLLIDLALKIAKKEQGCLFVIQNNKVEYEELITNGDINVFNVFDYPRRAELLAVMDGAIIFSPQGETLAYAVKIKDVKAYNGFGTRHSACYSASLKGNTCIMASEEDRKVKIFKDGRLVMILDPFEKNIEKNTHKAVNILEAIGVGTVGAVGVTSLAPSLGLVPIAGITIFGGVYYLVRRLKDLADEGRL